MPSTAIKFSASICSVPSQSYIDTFRNAASNLYQAQVPPYGETSTAIYRLSPVSGVVGKFPSRDMWPGDAIYPDGPRGGEGMILVIIIKLDARRPHVTYIADKS